MRWRSLWAGGGSSTWQSLAGAVGLYAAAVAFAAWHLRLLETPRMPITRIVVIALVALAPALLAALLGDRWRWRSFGALLVPTAVAAVGVETGHWPFRPHLLGSSGYFATVYDDVTEGLDSWVQIVLPYDPARHPELRVVVSLAIVGVFVALAGCLFVARAPLAAALVAFVPFLVVSTVYRLGDGSLRGAIMLALGLGFVALLAGAGGGRARLLQVGAAALVVGTATLLAAVPGVAKGQFLDWQHYRTKPERGRSVSYIWNQTYGPLHRPKKPFKVLEVSSSTGSYWRATVLDDFNGIAWVEAPVTVATAAGRPLRLSQAELAPAARTPKAGTRYTAEFKNVGLDSPYLLTAGQPQQVFDYPESVGVVSRTDAGVFLTQRAPTVKARWRVDAVRPSPRAADLNRLGPDYPADIVQRDLSIFDQTAQFPTFGEAGRAATMQQILGERFTDPQWRRWRDVYAAALRITKGAQNPYQATIALERYFQSTFSYSEKADFHNAADGPLPAFFFSKARAGYCQMFSGTMAEMLRMLGIPARVAEGFDEGQYSIGTTLYTVTDRDAHAWVEVYFPKYGWLPFEPTPSRSLPVTYSYSVTSSTFPTELSKIPTTSTSLLSSLLKQERLQSSGRAGVSGVARAADVANPSLFAVSGKAWQPGFFVVMLAIALGLALTLALVKQVRPLRARLARDPHSISTAVRADLEAFVRDQGIQGAVATLTPTEFAAMLRREFGVDGRRWARAQSRARYGPAAGGLEAAREARAEARIVKRGIRRGLSPIERCRGLLRPTSLVPISRSAVSGT